MIGRRLIFAAVACLCLSACASNPTPEERGPLMTPAAQDVAPPAPRQPAAKPRHHVQHKRAGSIEPVTASRAPPPSPDPAAAPPPPAIEATSPAPPIETASPPPEPPRPLAKAAGKTKSEPPQPSSPFHGLWWWLRTH